MKRKFFGTDGIRGRVGDGKGPTEPEGLQPFARGDVLVGATYLNNPNDDHAGRGQS